ncbi:uncharacterized protein LOC119786115 [Cyprinodon tularosa]|uniref:uncharacterized protein LOC119786115 n=1 Tax=Cyprinodon tularosa TaxID=77115 RepID=UPI0018E23BBC|nr:uncharacterized protein LOC119786115 [Cyprinodon tularosa]
MPRSVRLDRLAALEQPTDWAGASPRARLPMEKAVCKRSTGAAPSVPTKRARRTEAGRLSTKVDHLTAELAQMKALLQSFQTAGDRGTALPTEQDETSVNDDDAVSVAASGTHFCEDLPELGSGASGSDSIASQEDTGESVTSAIRTALARLQISVPQAQRWWSASGRSLAGRTWTSLPQGTHFIVPFGSRWTTAALWATMLWHTTGPGPSFMPFRHSAYFFRLSSGYVRRGTGSCWWPPTGQRGLGFLYCASSAPARQCVSPPGEIFFPRWGVRSCTLNQTGSSSGFGPCKAGVHLLEIHWVHRAYNG